MYEQYTQAQKYQGFSLHAHHTEEIHLSIFFLFAHNTHITSRTHKIAHTRPWKARSHGDPASTPLPPTDLRCNNPDF